MNKEIETVARAIYEDSLKDSGGIIPPFEHDKNEFYVSKAKAAIHALIDMDWKGIEVNINIKGNETTVSQMFLDTTKAMLKQILEGKP